MNTQALSFLIGFSFFAGNKDNHKVLDGFEFRPVRMFNVGLITPRYPWGTSYSNGFIIIIIIISLFNEDGILRYRLSKLWSSTMKLVQRCLKQQQLFIYFTFNTIQTIYILKKLVSLGLYLRKQTLKVKYD